MPQLVTVRPVARLRRVAAACALTALAAALSGCLTADGVLQPDGTATLTLTYAAPPGASPASQRERLTATGIAIEALSIAPDRTVTATLRVTDLAAIGRTALLKDATVKTATEGDVTTLTIAVVVKQPPRKPDGALPGPRIRITVPGTIVDASTPGTRDGSTVTWAFRLGEWLASPERTLAVRYRPAKTATPPPAAATGPAPRAVEPE